MTKTRRLAVAAMVLALAVVPLSDTALAAGEEAGATAQTHLTLNGQPLAGIDTFSLEHGLPTVAGSTMEANALMQPIYVRPHHHNQGAAAAIFLGAAGAIIGTATLVYANRPECNFAPYSGGCGYGTKVTGGAILAAGIVGLVLGAALWH